MSERPAENSTHGSESQPAPSRRRKAPTVERRSKEGKDSRPEATDTGKKRAVAKESPRPPKRGSTVAPAPRAAVVRRPVASRADSGSRRSLKEAPAIPPVDQIEPASDLPDPIPGVAQLQRPDELRQALSEFDSEVVQRRMDRLELGLRLLVETFKRGFGELAGDLNHVRADIAKLTTPGEVERAVARAATPADVEQITVEALRPLHSILAELSQRAETTFPNLREAVNRLVDDLDAAPAIVDQAARPETGTPNGRGGGIPVAAAPAYAAHAIEQPVAPAVIGEEGSSPDPATIWGEENGNDPRLQTVLGQRDHRRRSGVRRRLEKSWPGRAYAQWKWRRT